MLPRSARSREDRGVNVAGHTLWWAGDGQEALQSALPTSRAGCTQHTMTHCRNVAALPHLVGDAVGRHACLRMMLHVQPRKEGT